MRVTIRHGAVLKCDAEVPKTPEQVADPASGPGPNARCPAVFTSYSAVPLIRPQAVAEGWGRVWAWQVTGDMAATARIRQDVCPDHNAIAGLNAQRRDEIVQAQREAAKATKATEKAQKDADKLAARVQRDTERTEKKVAKQKARDDRKAERAALKDQKNARKTAARKWSQTLKEDKAKRKAERAAAKQGGVHTGGIAVQSAARPITTPETSQ